MVNVLDNREDNIDLFENFLNQLPTTDDVSDARKSCKGMIGKQYKYIDINDLEKFLASLLETPNWDIAKTCDESEIDHTNGPTLFNLEFLLCDKVNQNLLCESLLENKVKKLREFYSSKQLNELTPINCNKDTLLNIGYKYKCLASTLAIIKAINSNLLPPNNIG